MRDFRDAKVMAHSLRAALAVKGHKVSVGESLELIAHAYGVADWNTLSALINEAPKLPPAAAAYKRGEWPAGRRMPLVECSARVDEVLRHAVEIATQRGHWGQLCAEHVLLALTDDPEATDKMETCGADVELVRRDVSGYLDGLVSRSLDEVPPEQTSWNLGFVSLPAMAIAAMSGRSEATGADMLDSVRHNGGPAARILSMRGYDQMQAFHYTAAQAMEPRLPVAFTEAHTWGALMWGNYNYDRNLRQSDRFRKTLREAVDHAMQRQHDEVSSTHVLLALVDDPDAGSLMNACGIDLERLKAEVAELLDGQAHRDRAGRLRPWLDAAIKLAFEIARTTGARRLTGAHLLVSLISEPSDRAGQFLRDRGINSDQGLLILRGHKRS